MLQYRRALSSAVLACALLSPNVHAADKIQSGLIINSVIPNGSGVMIGFSARPSDCSSSYKNSHAFLSGSTAGFDELYALVSAVEITGAPVKVTYGDKGNCSSVGTMLQISHIE